MKLLARAVIVPVIVPAFFAGAQIAAAPVAQASAGGAVALAPASSAAATTLSTPTLATTTLASAERGTSAAAKATTLKATVGPGFTISLKKGSTKVKKLKKGAYIIKVSDKSDIHNFRLKGPGVNKATSVSAKGNTTWKVTLKKGTYLFVCDPHPEMMRGTFKVS